MTLPTTKREKLCYLLDHWDDIFSPPVSGYGRSSGDDTPHLSPMSRHASVVELVRCLDVLKRDAPSQHDHLMAFHTCETRTRRWYETKKRKGGKTETVARAERQPMVPSWVRRHKVELAEERLVVLFRGPVFIPAELWDALTLSSAEIDAKERGRLAGSGRAVAV